jgi:uncharacterized protein HemX
MLNREPSLSDGLWNRMIPLASDSGNSNGLARIGSQPIAFAAGTLIIVLGIGLIALWRAYTGVSPEQDRIAAARQLQIRAAQASEELIEKTKGLEATQQESIDQLQVIQDQLQTMKRVLAAQQAEAKRLSDQVSGLTEAIDGLRQSFASARASEASNSSSERNNSGRAKSRVVHRRRAKARG